MEKEEKKKTGKGKKALKVLGGVCTFLGFSALAYHLFGGKDGGEYSDSWFKSLSDEDLEAKREALRLDWCHKPKDISEAVRIESLLNRFDEEMCDRARAKMPTEYRSPRHREHGWYLDNDD